MSPHHHYQFALDIPPQPQAVPKKRSYLSASSDHKQEYAKLRNKMGQSHHLQQQNLRKPTASRFGLKKSMGGEIVEVQGGHIIRSTGLKDRHSKVCTAKGPRDRRVRLSAHTAIQFYDVQDRLGYDRPSKAVDWLIKKAKAAIDELAELPAWKPTAVCSTPKVLSFEQDPPQPPPPLSSQLHENNQPSFLPPSLDSDSIDDTIKSFFPVVTSQAAANTSSSMHFQSFPPPPQNQDLKLSLQFQDPLHHHHNHQNEQVNLFTVPSQLSFDGPGWSEHSSWGGGGGGGGYMFNSPNQTPPFLQPLFGQTNSQLFTPQQQQQQQRESLQSSNTSSVRAWIDLPLQQAFSNSTANDHHQYHQTLSFHPSSIMSGGIEFAAAGGFPGGFRIPARIQGEEEEHYGIYDRPSSASSDSPH